MLAVITFVCITLSRLIPFRETELFLALLTSRTELRIPGFHCLDQVSHHQQFSCSMLHMQDQTKTFQISHHISPGTVPMLVFLPFICSNLDLYVRRFYINCLITCLYFSLSAREGGKIRLGRKVNGELHLK